ncbi:MAG: LysM peptidoglycan-binding domain-containing protein [Clostridiales bacterium]|nr:LysM peptidoglycan-binding domain-containing protein [Clostridiales bacterium]
MYKMYIDGVLLPVTPEKMDTKIKNKNKRLTLLNEGEVNLLKTPGLTEINIEIILPNNKYPFAIYEKGFKYADYYLNKLEDLKTSKTAFRFIVSRISPNGKLIFNSNMMVSIEDYIIKEDAGKLGIDIAVKIKLKQYREFGTKILKMSEDGTTATIENIRSAKIVSEFYTIKSGDTLYEIAKRELGDGEKYIEIMNINGIDNPNNIVVGQVIKLV